MSLEGSLTRLIWKIENFSCFENESFLESLPSPSFTSRSGVEWNVRIYPQFRPKIYSSGRRGEPSIKIELHQLNLQEATVSCSVSLLDSEGTPLLWRDREKWCRVPQMIDDFYPEEKIVMLFDLIKVSEVYGPRKSKFLPNGVLTMECRICESGLVCENLELFARTRIEPRLVINKRFDLNVSNVNTLQPGTIWEHEEPLSTNSDTLSILLELSSTEEFSASITSSLVYIEVKCKIYVLSTTGKRVMFTDIECSFNEKTKKHLFDTNIKMNMLKNFKDQFLPNDVLTLGFDCKVGCKVSFNRLIQENEHFAINTEQIALPVCQKVASAPKPIVQTAITPPSLPEPPNNVTGVVKDIFKKAYHSDFSFKVENRTFQVHKAILGARSTVFDAMFASDMKESKDSSVDITDFDALTIQRMLDYIYTDQVDKGLEWNEYSDLYSAADKYDLVQLKKTCSTVLQERLVASNVLEILKLADMHQDLELKDAVLEYISKNDNEVIGTSPWQEFLKQHAQLALEAFQALYIKKMNQ